MFDAEYRSSILESLTKVTTLREKVDAMKDTAKGQHCLVLACGPSLTTVEKEKLRKFAQDKIVISVKQAYEYLPEYTDFLILNTWNYQKYDFSLGRPVVIYEHGPSDPPVYGEHDLEFQVPVVSDPSEQLARSLDFDRYLFEKQIERPWGPGVLYEVGFYLAVHLGVSQITTIGWDVGAKSSSVMPHFYDVPSAHRTRSLAKARHIPDKRSRNSFLHSAGVLYNKPRIIPEEVEVCAGASGPFFDWFQGKGIGLEAVTNSELISDRIPRVTL
ncbi:hypothetical protein RMQ97_14855 [Maricaulis sp. D1M11]|uniref:hypothetical protein n=1 Tax=Maricaulis sp. D1M11 TaxID=3076117 RepID=UPI0039B4F743